MPTSEPFPVEVRLTRRFSALVKQYQKKYRSITADLAPFIQQLVQHETPGDRLQGTGDYVVYKERVKNSDNNKGQSAGYRICYLVFEPEPALQKRVIVLLIIYAKSDRESIDANEVLGLIGEYVASNTKSSEE